MTLVPKEYKMKYKGGDQHLNKEKSLASAKIKEDTQAFLNAGGKIKKLEPNEFGVNYGKVSKRQAKLAVTNRL